MKKTRARENGKGGGADACNRGLSFVSAAVASSVRMKTTPRLSPPLSRPPFVKCLCDTRTAAGKEDRGSAPTRLRFETTLSLPSSPPDTPLIAARFLPSFSSTRRLTCRASNLFI